jgi:mono/diheme cytochrome c family protein
MKRILLTCLTITALYSCSSNGSETKEVVTSDNNTPATAQTPSASSNDRGIGKFTEVKIEPALNKEMATKGQNVFDVKCSSCHKLTDEKLVGPGWKGVTSRHTPEWIMNFVTNVEEMLNKDPKAQAQLEICLVRMPNQNLTDDDARSVYEYMRQVDGVK